MELVGSEMNDRIKRLLVIGSGGKLQDPEEQTSIKNVGWAEICKEINVRDFDAVVMNLGAADFPAAVDFDRLNQMLEPRVVAEMLAHGVHAVLVGDPRAAFGNKDRTFLHWTGIDFHWDNSSGVTLKAAETEEALRFAPYLRAIDRFQYSLSSVSIGHLKTALRHCSGDDKGNIRADAIALQLNKYGKATAFVVSMAGDKGWTVPGKLFFLPPTRREAREDLAIAIRVAFGLPMGEAGPTWAEGIAAPLEGPLKDRLAALQSQLEATHRQIDEAEAQRKQTRRPLVLLHGAGEDLEEATWSCLMELGGLILRPSSSTDEDALVEVEVGGKVVRWAVEVKGTKKSQPKDEWIGQVLKWVGKAKDEKLEDFKGMLVVNLDRHTHPDCRKPEFSDEFQRRLALHKICLVESRDLYEVLHRKLEGSDLSAMHGFWRVAAEASGVISRSAILSGERLRFETSAAGEPREGVQ